MIASKRIFRYVKGTLDISITLIPQLASATLSTYFGADWAGCPNTHRSIIGYLVYVGSNPISCALKDSRLCRIRVLNWNTTLSFMHVSQPLRFASTI